MRLSLGVVTIATVALVAACTGAPEQPHERTPIASSPSDLAPPSTDVASSPEGDDVTAEDAESGPEPTEDRPVTALARLFAARETWAALGLQDYAFVFQRDCFCPPEATGPFDVIVTGGTISSIDGQPVDAGQDLVPTVTQMHDRIEQDLARGALVTGGYNRHGLPANLYVDPTPPLDLGNGTEVPNAIDDEVTYTARLVTAEDE